MATTIKTIQDIDAETVLVPNTITLTQDQISAMIDVLAATYTDPSIVGIGYDDCTQAFFYQTVGAVPPVQP